jgi:putative effector of murein hydrolase
MFGQNIAQIFSSQSFYWLAVTIGAYCLALLLFRLLGRRVIFHPILLGSLLVGLWCAITLNPISEYQDHQGLLTWLLGPATVALAVPLYGQLRSVLQIRGKGLLVVILGGSVGPLTAIALLYVFGFSHEIQISALTKSITTPLAMETSDSIGGIPALAAALVSITGITAVLFSRWIFRLTQCHCEVAQGLTLGTIAHAIGTAEAMQTSQKAGAFATMALCVNGIVTAVVLPVVFLLLV